MKILFMGTPDFAAACLDALCRAGHEICAAVTQPDKPKGRHYKMIPPPVKVLAEERNIPVFQPETMKNEAFLATLTELAPEIIVVAAYGKILPAYIIKYPKYGCINAHGSLLPRYRGASPIQRAIMDGEKETGITIMYMNEGLDTGDMILSEATEITPEDNFESVHDRLAEIAGRTLVTAIDMLQNGTAKPEKQDDSLSNYAPKITKEDCILDFTLPAETLVNRIRGLSPFPLAQTKTPDGRLLKIVGAKTAEGFSDAKPGTVAAVDNDGFEIVCGNKRKIRVTAVLPEGKGRMSAADFVRGRRLEAGERLS